MLRKLLTLFLLCFVGVTYSFAQSGSIQGTITDANSGEPLPATNIYLPDLERGASTDANGEYLIEGIPAGTYTVRVTYIGYSTVTRQAEVDNDATIINIELQRSSQNLDELVVVGFGSTSQRNLTGSVESVSAEEIEEAHLTTFEGALQGKAAGVQITSTSGVLGAPVSVRVRGTTSISASSQPLYVVDGIPLTDAGGSIGSGFGGTATNPFLNINPSNIKSIQVLKSATSAAVYGARGSNGVVLIETKSGESGKTQINIGTSVGFTEPTEQYDILNGPQFQEMANVGIRNFFRDIGFPDASAAFIESTGFGPFFNENVQEVASTDWADLVTRTGTIQNYNASVSGGSSETQFYFSANYSDEEGYARPNQLEQFNVLAKIDHTFNENLDIGISISPTRSENSRVAISNAVAAPYTYAALEAPVIPQFYPNGEINDGMDSQRAPGNSFGAFSGTPFGNAVGIELLQTLTQVNTSAYADYSFTPTLALKTDFSVQYLQSEEEQRNANFATDGFPVGVADANNEQYLNYNWNNTLTYTNDWDDHSLTAVAGITFQRETVTSIALAGDTFLSNDLTNLASAANITFGSGTGSSFAFQNNLGRINYSFKDRYLLTLTASYNGSSRFGETEQYGFFPAGSVGWIISDEEFAEADFLSFLKLRAGYGIIGNASIGNFANLALLSAGADYNSQPGIVLGQLSNPGLKWEETAQLDVGLDYGFLDNRVRGSLSYYNKQTSDLLLARPISATNGFTGFTENIGEIENTGLEFDIAADILTGDFSWSLNANVSTINNEVKSLPEGQDIIFGESLIREGEALGSFFVREYAGVNPENGDALYFFNGDTDVAETADGVFQIDKFGDRFVTDNFSTAQRIIGGDPFPDIFGGFGTNVAYKGLSLNVNFNYSLGNEIYWADGSFLRTNLSSIFNQDVSQLDYWTPENTDASVPEPRFFTNNGSTSTGNGRYLEDGSYLRLKSATVGYTLPREWVNGNEVRVYAQGTNLLTFTDFQGLDPEVTPASGANATQGNVFFQPPQQRTIQFGVNLGF